MPPSLEHLDRGTDRVWFYVDSQTNDQRGPVPTSVITRLFQKGIGIIPTTLIWKSSMTEWLPIGEVPEFKDLVQFQNTRWFYLDHEHNQKGPVLSRYLLHILKEGEIDGMTLVFGGELTEWKPLSEVPQLKIEMQKIVEEEEALQRLSTQDARDMVFNPDAVFEEGGVGPTGLDREDVIYAPEEAGHHNPKKCFVADDGLRYEWDDEEQNWVLAENDDDDQPLMDEEDADGGDSRYRKRKDVQRGDPDSEIEEADELDDNEYGEEVNTSVKESNGTSTKEKTKRKKRKKNKGPNLWVYITGLPPNVTVDEIKDHFSKVGIIAISPYDQQPRIKIYKEDKNSDVCKGDASLCYVAEPSVQLALDVLDGGYIRPNFKITVTRANFEVPAGGSTTVNGTASDAANVGRKPPPSQAQIKVARNAAKQALAWNEDDDAGIANKSSALRIIVLEGMFRPEEFANESFESELEQDVAGECGKFGVIEKITIFSKNPRGIIVIKYSTAFAAQECIKVMNGRFFGAVKIKSYFWDGVTNYSIVPIRKDQEEKEEKEEEARLEGFGQWLDDQQDDLPDEFRLQTE